MNYPSVPFNKANENSMSHETASNLFSKANLVSYLSNRLRQTGGKRKAVVLFVIYLGGICTLLFTTDDTMRDTYGRSIDHVKTVTF